MPASSSTACWRTTELDPLLTVEQPRGADHLRTFILAFKQVMVAGTPSQQDQAVKILAEARKQLYRLLSDD